MNKAFIFPGQGSQYVGMGLDLYNEFLFAQEYYEVANEILGYDLARVCFYGPKEKLLKTQFTQPAIFVHSIIIDSYLKNNNIIPNAVAGHSLGEFSALVSANILTFKDALQIIKVRSHAMGVSNDKQAGAMAAIIGANDIDIATICNQDGIVIPANINAPGQIVISGEKKAVHNAIDKAKEIGIRRIIPLNVSGAFHSPLMQPACKPLQKIIKSVNFQETKIPIYQNISAKPITDIISIQNNILNQLEKPVLWKDTIENMIKDGITNFIELGPGKVLKGLNRQINKEISTINFDKIEDLNSHAVL
tara:strand:- start:4306 stop:5220 length:915 start_codon:yes stop_codon:yes gene_type:complete